ncbi:MAG TPA: transposase [Anaerolineales bacterium]|nr:transposase [Anaerolineales bacterium]
MEHLNPSGIDNPFLGRIHRSDHHIYITWTDRKAFMADLKEVYQATTRESAEAHLRQLSEKWSNKYAITIRSWQNNWEDLATFFAYPTEIRRLIYTTNAV